MPDEAEQVRGQLIATADEMTERLFVHGACEEQAVVENGEFGKCRLRAPRQIEEAVDHGCELRARLQTREVRPHAARRHLRRNADHHTKTSIGSKKRRPSVLQTIVVTLA